MNKKSKKLILNTILFFIGSIGSKFIQFFLVPLYTYTLTQSEFGITDLVITTINFLIPIFSIQISDGFLRFGLEKKVDKNAAINSAFRVLICGSLISIVLSPIFSISNLLKEWIIYFLLILNLRMYRDIFSIILKIDDKNKVYAIDSILYTFVLCVCSFLFLSVFKFGINGYFMSYIIANLFSIIFIVISSKISIKKIILSKDNELLKKMTIYSLPLIINSIAYWITTASDRYMINIFMSDSDLGIYAVATKIPTILSTFISVFSQAWLISSISEYEEDRDTSFYIKTFENFYSLSFITCAFLILIIKIFMRFYVSPDFYFSWKYAPVLIYSAVFSGFATFLNGILYAYKKNILATTTTLVGAIINIILNLLLIPKYGIMGASVATIISWFIISQLKIYKIEKMLNIKLDNFLFYISMGIVLCSLLVVEFISGLKLYILNSLCFVLILIINKKVIKSIIEILLSKIRRRK